MYRFDGSTFEHFALGDGRHATVRASAVFAAPDGKLWVGYEDGRVAQFIAGHLVQLFDLKFEIIHFARGAGHSVWAEVGRRENPLVQLLPGSPGRIRTLPNEPHAWSAGVIATRDGAIWLSTVKDIFRLPNGGSRLERVGSVNGKPLLTEDRVGQVWLSDASGSRPLETAPRAGSHVYPTTVSKRKADSVFGPDGNLWLDLGNQGLFRIRNPSALGAISKSEAAASIEKVEVGDPRVANFPLSIFFDREGDLWVGSYLGLDRFRDVRVVVEPKLTQLPRYDFALLAGSDGSVYVGQADSIYRVPPHGRPQPLRENTGEVRAICEGPRGSIWFALVDKLLRYKDGRFQSFPQIKPEVDPVDCAVDGSGALWLSTINDGTPVFRNGRWSKGYWVATNSEPHPTTLISAGGSIEALTYPDTITRLDADATLHPILRGMGDANTLRMSPRGLLVGREDGLGRLADGRYTHLSTERFPWLDSVTGVLEARTGQTWLMTSGGIAAVATSELNKAFSDPTAKLHPQLLGVFDGLPAGGTYYARRGVVEGGDNRIWFATSVGVVWVDPTRHLRTLPAPPVLIRNVTAGDRNFTDPADLTLAPGTSRVTIGYTGQSLSVPERVHFRYRLQGVDDKWVDAGGRRQAFYTNLGPGSYVFLVRAANADGKWSPQPATLRFTIPPTFLQSIWFTLLCILAGAILVVAAYRLRVRQVTQRLRGVLEERMDERERIARDLHDTLLQSFQGLILRFQALAWRLPEKDAFRGEIEVALDQADDILADGRRRVGELRVVDSNTDLADIITRSARALAAGGTGIGVLVEGTVRPVHPMCVEEMRMIAEEALRNALAHAEANRIDVLIQFDDRGVRLSVEDDGRGMPEAADRKGHFGLIGMRERAERIGAALEVSSGKRVGTQILVDVPARTAFAKREHGLRR